MAAKVFIVSYESQADYKVHFCDYEGQQKNHQIILGGKLVQSAFEADVKVVIVESPYQSDITIMRKHFPRG